MSSRTDLPGDTDRRTRGLQPETLSATEARQGNRGRPVLIVLLGGLILAMLVWVPAEWWGNSIETETRPNPAQTETAPPASQTPTQ
ncbi:hypothetical protein [Rhizobium sp. SL42]|uniref:hypothetical protein n=1 Tax=Rhizobium sp. SL42 TaxID=2806346 RepID=UPI001F20F6EB|nr:hypothetical protein [Rhizobium sp. SL42]UJW75623.1 hypothetical protein IM739_03740 [Rhizobium sp. SL42]